MASSSPEERMRILKLIESGQVKAEEGAQLLEALGAGAEPARARGRTNPRFLRIRVIDLHSQRQKINVTIPVSLVDIGLKLGARLVPRIAAASAQDILHAIASGATGRILEVQDLEEAERIEIFME
jgi:hypothetical protein